MSAAASGLIRSPQTAIGIAGGQLTAASAQTRPTASRTGTLTRRESSASRGESTRSPGSGIDCGLRSEGRRRGRARLTVSYAPSSSPGVNISTTQSASTYSGSVRQSRRQAASSGPVQPKSPAGRASFSGSPSDGVRPSSRASAAVRRAVSRMSAG